MGYPEKVDVSARWPTSPEYYNSAIVVNRDGETVANYRKSFLWATDEKWALEGTDGFFYSDMQDLGQTAMGIGKLVLSPKTSSTPLITKTDQIRMHSANCTDYFPSINRHGLEVCLPPSHREAYADILQPL